MPVIPPLLCVLFLGWIGLDSSSITWFPLYFCLLNVRAISYGSCGNWWLNCEENSCNVFFINTPGWAVCIPPSLTVFIIHWTHQFPDCFLGMWIPECSTAVAATEPNERLFGFLIFPCLHALLMLITVSLSGLIIAINITHFQQWLVPCEGGLGLSLRGTEPLSLLSQSRRLFLAHQQSGQQPSLPVLLPSWSSDLPVLCNPGLRVIPFVLQLTKVIHYTGWGPFVQNGTRTHLCLAVSLSCLLGLVSAQVQSHLVSATWVSTVVIPCSRREVTAEGWELWPLFQSHTAILLSRSKLCLSATKHLSLPSPEALEVSRFSFSHLNNPLDNYF